MGGLTEAGVFSEEVGEAVTLVFVVAAVVAVAVGRHADLGRAKVVRRHHSACEGEGWRERERERPQTGLWKFKLGAFPTCRRFLP